MSLSFQVYQVFTIALYIGIQVKVVVWPSTIATLTMNRVDRLLALLILLQSRRYTTITYLVDYFDLSERTIFRDLKALNGIGIPIEHASEKGYFLGEGFFLPPISLSVDEVHALSLAEPLIVRFADKSIKVHYDMAMSKLKLVLNKAQQEQLSKVQRQAVHFIPDQYQQLLPNTELLAPLQRAISEQLVTRIQYKNVEGISSERKLEPIGLTFYALNWHLIAWCQLRESYRDFRVSRIQALTVSLESFAQRNHLTLAEYLVEHAMN